MTNDLMGVLRPQTASRPGWTSCFGAKWGVFSKGLMVAPFSGTMSLSFISVLGTGLRGQFGGR